MNYYETKYPYYALIPAKSKEGAIEIYTDEICEDDDNCLKEEMKEISQLRAFIKFADVMEKECIYDTIGVTIDDFYNAHILLIDGALR